LEDKVLKRYPAEIKRIEERITGYTADIARLAAQPPIPKEVFPPMTIGGILYADKKAAGAALLEACRAMNNPDPVSLGEYRGFPMELSFDSFGKEYRVTLKGTLSHTVSLGSDIFGNITRLDNALEGMDVKLAGCQEQLANTRAQMETAKAEIQTPFPREAELAEKTARLAELTVSLRLEENDREILDSVPDEGDIQPPRKGREPERDEAR